MKRQNQVEGLVKLYREFSRQKYNKYKHKFPKMKESEIISKVQKEWDSLDEQAKLNLQKFYQQKNYLTSDPADSSPQKRPLTKRQQNEKSSRDSKGSKQKPGLQKLKVLEDDQERVLSQSDQSSVKYKRKVLVQQDSDRQEPILNPQVGKKIKKITKITSDTKNKEYLSFFKYYYDKLSSEHPKWKPSQISTIIKLLWKKRLITKKKQTSSQKKQIKAGKGILRVRKLKKTSGYLTFKKKFITKHGPGTAIKSIRQTFKRLTFEGKQLLSLQAKIANNEHFPIKAKIYEDTKSRMANILDPSNDSAPRCLPFLNNIMSN